MTAEDFAQLRSINARMLTALEEYDFEGWSALNRQFHSVIYGRCPNRRLIEELQRLSQWTDTVSSLVFSRERGIIIQTLGFSAGRETIDSHERIVEALEQGRFDASLEEISRDHTLVLVRRVQEKLAARSVA
jgi:DNA-binding GntR family transcriptional regulator